MWRECQRWRKPVFDLSHSNHIVVLSCQKRIPIKTSLIPRMHSHKLPSPSFHPEASPQQGCTSVCYYCAGSVTSCRIQCAAVTPGCLGRGERISCMKGKFGSLLVRDSDSFRWTAVSQPHIFTRNKNEFYDFTRGPEEHFWNILKCCAFPKWDIWLAKAKQK